MAIASGSTPGGDDLKALQQLLAAGSGGSSADAGRVYMGSTRYTKGGQDKGSGQALPRGKSMYGAKDIWASPAEAEQDYFHWSFKKQQDFVSQCVLAGRLKLGAGLDEGASEWAKLVKVAAKYGSAGQKVQPWDLLAIDVKAAGGGNAWVQRGPFEFNTQTGQSRYVGPGTYLGGGKAQQVDTRVDLTDPDTAKAVATKLFQDMMGRDPGAGELTGFASALHSAEQNSPVVNTTTTQYDMDTGQPISSDTTSSGGISAEGKAYIGEQQVKGKKEYGAYQAATTYQNVLDSLVFGGPGA
jgi:hypothetical protein